MIESTLLYLFALAALGGGVLMLVLRHPMRVALALVATMLSLAAVYGLLGVHVIAVFQVLIYVGAVMVFMVYVIMLIDVRDRSFVERYSKVVVPGIVGALLFAAVLTMMAVSGGQAPAPGAIGRPPFGVQPFAALFLNDYWLYFELTSVLLVIAVVAALAVIKERGRRRG
jgi:NADH-quinone oxidoreductase subunit J